MSWISRYSRAAGPPRFSVLAVLLAVMELVSTTAPSPSFTPGFEPHDWPTADGNGGTHYSVLSDISADNVEYLDVACGRIGPATCKRTRTDSPGPRSSPPPSWSTVSST